MSHYYQLNDDKTTTPIDVESLVAIPGLWAIDNWRVGFDVVGDREVSTVFLVIDHSHGGGVPILFETMVFAADDIGNDLYCDRYATWDKARAGHERVVAALRAGVAPEDLEDPS